MLSYRWARLTSGRRAKYVMLVFWLLLATAAGPLALKLTEVQDNDTLGALPASAEYNRAVQLAEEVFSASKAPLAVAVYVRDSGLTDADRAKVAAHRAACVRR